MNFNNLLSKENVLIFFSVLIICISIFGIPSENNQYLVIVILPVVALVIIQKVSQLEFIRHFFIKRSLADIEIRLREINSNYDYYSIPEETKKEDIIEITETNPVDLFEKKVTDLKQNDLKLKRIFSKYELFYLPYDIRQKEEIEELFQTNRKHKVRF